MARATRSTVQADKDKTRDVTPAIRKSGAKKRKRNSNEENGDEPTAKQARTDDSPEIEEQPADTQDVELRGSGDVPIDPTDAQKILDVLEIIDTQGLLDRVFPLPTEPLNAASPERATPPASTQTYSFRALLRNSSQHPLRVLRSAIQHLFPISSHPRSRPSAPAAQQLRFCNLALSLLDLASFHSVPTPLEVESLFPTLFPTPSSDPDSDAKPSSVSPSALRNGKYALVQRLPTGDWWTSLNSDFAPRSDDGKTLKDLPTGYAELAAILPSASSSTLVSQPEKTLAAYVTKRTGATLQQAPGPRRVSCGKFLSYGPYASFGPSFDQDGAEVGKETLGEVIWQQQEKARIREIVKGKRRALSASEDSVRTIAELTDPSDADKGDKTGLEKRTEMAKDWDIDFALEGLLPPEQVEAIKIAMDNAALEDAVQELLDRNGRALKRLQKLQRERLGAEDGGTSTVEEGSEEWETAQAIIDSLVLLASLRPRSTSDHESEPPPLIPRASVLRMLQRTLPVGATQGWYGTLPPSRTTALRDDSTVQIKPGVPVAAPAVTATAVAAAATPTKPVAPATPYTPYNYSTYPASQYRGGYGTYTPGQASTYYPNYAPPTSGQAAGGGQYPNQQYSTPGQYPYSSWYNYSHQASAPQAGSTAGSTSGAATPQPVQTPTAIPTNYASFFASTAQQQPQPQRAVANTVLTAATAKGYQPGAWAGGQPTSNYVPPTLPPHLRSVGAASTPGTPQPTTPGGHTYPHGYYGGYQPAPPTAPAAR